MKNIVKYLSRRILRKITFSLKSIFSRNCPMPTENLWKIQKMTGKRSNGNRQNFADHLMFFLPKYLSLRVIKT